MQNFIGYEGLTNEQIKTKVLSGFYSTGKVNGYYMTGVPKGKANPFRFYILRWLRYNRTMCLVKTAENFVDDFYQLVFLELFKIPADRFCKDFFDKDGVLMHTKLCATAARITILKGFARLENGYTNHSLITHMMHASAFQLNNESVSPMENNEDEEVKAITKTVDDFTTVLVDQPSIDDFLSDYNFTPDDIINQLTEDELALFTKSLGKNYIPKSEEYVALKEKIRRLKDEL